ncbi:TPA: hypothetical protein ACS53J_003949, partial [Salmonella enterica]
PRKRAGKKSPPAAETGRQTE